MEPLLLPGIDVPDWATDVVSGETLVIDGLPNSLYHNSKALISKSALDLAARSAAHFWWAATNPLLEKEEPSEALVIGSAFHCYVLEPDVFRREYVVMPHFGDMRSPRSRALREAWQNGCGPNTQFLTKAQFTMIDAMRESLYRHKKIRRILENGRPEVTCAALCPHTGLPRKCRWDWLSEIDGLGLDLKTARDGSQDMWRLEAAARRYNVQDRYYTDTSNLCGVDVQEVAFAVIEKEPPYICGLYVVDATAKLSGEHKYMNDLNRIYESVRNGYFEGYGDDAKEISLPGWAVADVAIGA